MDIFYRKKKNNKFYYYNKKNELLKNKKKIDLIKSYVLPPAWTNVIINLSSKDIFATGYDKIGRKQYKYTREHDDRVSKQKFCNLLFLGYELGNINNIINKHINNKNFNDINLYISIIIKIIIICNFRIGNYNNLKKYNSYGISTIKKKHIQFINNSKIKIEFNGKKGVLNTCIIDDSIINYLIKKIYKQNNNSNTIFYINDKNININDVNNFLKQFNKNISSKDFRTWNANKICCELLLKYKNQNFNYKERKKIFKNILTQVAQKLHHTESICKNKYLDMNLYNKFIECDDKKYFFKFSSRKKYNYLSNGENLFMNYLHNIC